MCVDVCRRVAPSASHPNAYLPVDPTRRDTTRELRLIRKKRGTATHINCAMSHVDCRFQMVDGGRGLGMAGYVWVCREGFHLTTDSTNSGWVAGAGLGGCVCI